MQRLEVSGAVRLIYGSLGVKWLTAIWLSPGGSGYFTCIQNMKLVTNKCKSGGLHEKREEKIYFSYPESNLRLSSP